MFALVILLLSLLNIATHITSEIHDGSGGDKNAVTLMNLNYTGEKFPIQYLVPDNAVPTILDLNRYLNYLQRSINYFGKYPNKTDCNLALSVFISKSLLKRTLLDDRNKLQSSHINLMSKVINKAEYVLSHYIYRNSFYDWSDLEYRFCKLLQNDETLVHNIGKFNRNRLQTWVLSKEYMNEFIEEIDEGTLPKEKYVELVESMDDYFINLRDSDLCVSRVAYNPEPLDISTQQPCLRDDLCKHRLTSKPSVAYSLSHRMLNVYLRLKLRNCYIMSEEDDLKLIDKLCSFMYRETVYIARRGFFSRDLFLEHTLSAHRRTSLLGWSKIGYKSMSKTKGSDGCPDKVTLCALLGYEEFHRQNWFNKALSWMNDRNCIKEFRNFEMNRTKLVHAGNKRNHVDPDDLVKAHCEVMNSACDQHPSALLLSVLSHAVRHTVHFMQQS